MKLAPVQSLAQLKAKMLRDPNYDQLARSAAHELGGNPTSGAEALEYLNQQAELDGYEDSVIEVVNACRDTLF